MNINYEELYNDLIASRLNEPLPDDVYTEAHHIKPASMCRYSKRFGERIDYMWDVDADHKDNIIRLLPSEHFMAHYYLWKFLRTPKTAAALRLMMSTTATENITDDTLSKTSIEYETLRSDLRPLLVAGAKMNLPLLIERGRINNKERVADGTHNFVGVMPWDNIKVKSNPNSLFAWERMHDIHKIWVSHDKCTYRKLSRIAAERLGVVSRLEGMVNVFKNPDRFEEVSVGWALKFHK